MGIHAALLGAGISSIITAVPVFVSEVNDSSVTVSVTFSSSGAEITTINGSNTVEGSWVTPPNTASDWEIRATLSSGTTPSGTLDTWEALTTSRVWSLSRSFPGTEESELVFEFRRVGDTDPEVTLSSSFLTAEVLDIF